MQTPINFYQIYSNSSSREGIPNLHNASGSMNSANNQKNKKMPKRKRVTANYQYDNNGGTSNSAISVNAIQKLNKQAQSQQQAQSNTNAANLIGKTIKMGASNR